MKTHSLRKRLKAVRLCLAGESCKTVAKRLGIDNHSLAEWVVLYKLHGAKGVRCRKIQGYSLEEKIEILTAYAKKDVPLYMISAMYNVAQSTVKQWAKKLEKGELTEARKCNKKTFEYGPTQKTRNRAGSSGRESEISRSGGGVPKKTKGLKDRKEEPTNFEKAEIIQSLRPKHRLKDLLRASGMTRSLFYYHIKEKADKHANLRQRIREIFEHHHGRYGYRRVLQELKNEGVEVNHKTVAKLMRDMGLAARHPKKRYKSHKGDVGKVAPNVLDRNFEATAPNRKWATDITQIEINGVKCYLSPTIDMWNCEIISYTISLHPNLKLVMDMLKKAFRKYKNLDSLVLHSDQGWHYQHTSYQLELKKHNVTQSMSRKGNCYDNALMEGFFGIMKTEFLYPNKFESFEDFKRQLKQYIDYYNNERIKLRLKMSPVEYRIQYLKTNFLNV